MIVNGSREGPSAVPAAPAAGAPGDSTNLAIITALNSPEMSEDTSDDADDLPSARSRLTDEDAESLIGLSMSHAASRLKSPSTPAIEKRNALEEGDRYLWGGSESPLEESPEGEQEAIAAPLPVPEVRTSLAARPSPNRASMPPTGFTQLRPSDPPQSSLHGVFSGLDRKRSLSGSADALRRLLPKNLPSMAQVGSMFSSASIGQRSPRLDATLTLPKDSGHVRSHSALIPAADMVLAARPAEAHSTKVLRPSTSDDNLLYHTLSRASSLGDDTRFENQHDQVNSRVKAIRDSLSDRTSFRLPQMPSMPSMPSFSFNRNFFAPNLVPLRWIPDADVLPDILPSSGTKKRSSTLFSPVVLPAITSVANSRSEVVPEPARAWSEVHPLDRVLESLTGDVVIMGGYRGSILRSTKTNRQVWVPVKVGLNIRKVNLEVGLEPEDEERMYESIYASGMLQNIGPVDISKRLIKRLSECENARSGKLRVWDYGYDWRLSPHILSRRLTAFLESLPSNQVGAGPKRGALVIAHSLGGVITRHVVNHRPELFSGVVYAGVPQSCVNILGPIRNGDAVLLSSRVLTAQVNFTLRTSFVLLPEDGTCFVDINTREKYPVDFFNVDHWIKYRFSPCTDPPLPPRMSTSGSLGSLLNRSSTLLNLSLPGRKSISSTVSPYTSTPPPISADDETNDPQLPSKITRVASALRDGDLGPNRPVAPQMDRTSNPISKGQSISSSVSTAVTIPRDKAITYLRRTLAETKKFKQELHFRPELEEQNKYPPVSLIYGKSIPTCCGAKVDGWEGIPCFDSYDNLAFASGDGVVLAKEAMLPPGYKVAYGGRVKSDRGHVTLLGDLYAVAKAIEAVQKVRARGIGLGLPDETLL
jgi:hypothetical protein